MKKLKLFLAGLFFVVVVFAGILGTAKSAKASSPVLNFSDLIDGPNVGLTDDQVSNQGAIVTIWGSNLGNSQGTSKVYVGSDGSGWTEVAHIYYWGNADGIGNGEHADLYTKQKMQEISFAISSATAIGTQKIKVSIGGSDSNQLDFYVRSTGNIFFVKTTGNDSANGSWGTPWLTINKATSGETGTHMHEGDIVYICDDISVNGTYTVDIGASARKRGTANNMMGLVVYPKASVSLTATSTGIRNFMGDNAYWVISKFSVDTVSTGIGCIRYSRIIGNKITGSVAEGQSGAISGGYNSGYDAISRVKVLGNYIHNFGSSSTSNKHHTTYFSIRYTANIPGIELGWNRLNDNKARFGLHYYDESAFVGGFTSPSSMHDNWIENQGGSGINIGSVTNDDGDGPYMTGTWYVYNNVLINCGLTTDQGVAANPNAIWIYGGINKFDVYLYNNLIYGYGDANSSSSLALVVPTNSYNYPFSGTWTYKNNIVVDTKNFGYANADMKSPTLSSNNLWYNGGDGNPANPPSWETNPITSNPLFVNSSSNNFALQSTSPAVNAGSSSVSSVVQRDFLGLSRPQGSGYDIGAFEYDEGSVADTIAPNAPGGLSIR